VRLRSWQADSLLLIVTAIWGATFPLVKNATDIGAGGVPTYWFLAARFSLATLVLSSIFWRRLTRLSLATWGAGLLIGLFLFAGFAFQTFGLGLTSSSKAGFITGLSVVLVPVLSVIWLKRYPRPIAWLGVVTAAVGLALLSVPSDLQPSYGDLLVFFCAICFALHITAVGRYTTVHDPIALSVVQIGGAAILSWTFHLWDRGTLWPGVEVIWWQGPSHVAWAWIICGLLATAAAFLLQNVLQPLTTPTHTALIFAAEPVWAALFSFFLLGEVLTTGVYLGAGLILVGMILAELPVGRQSPGHAISINKSQSPPLGRAKES